MTGLHGFKSRWIVCTSVLLLFSFTLFSSGNALAQRKPPPRHGTPKVHYGKVVKVLPAGHRAVHVGKVKYHYSHGVFYRPHRGTWVVVRPPIGAVVAGLATAAIVVTVSGTQYYLCDGIYYRKVPAGYEVVSIPEPLATVPAVGEKVHVIAHRLNVRSGPGMHHSVVRQLSEGTILIIKGFAPGWLYVELDDGTTGWVMKAHTTTVQAPAQG